MNGCLEETWSWWHFNDQQTDGYWIRCTLAIPHEEHEDANTGLTWTEELPEMSKDDGYALGGKSGRGAGHPKGWGNGRDDSNENAGNNEGRGKPPKSGEHDRPNKK